MIDTRLIRSTELTPAELDRYREILQDRKQALSESVEHLRERAEEESGGNMVPPPGDEADAVVAAFERDLSMQIAVSKSEELRELDLALLRLDARTFGRCRSCGSMISAPRLGAIPEAHRCIACQTMEEIAGTKEEAEEEVDD